MTPFLWLVIASFAVFVIVLGSVSTWCRWPEREAPAKEPSTAAAAETPKRAA